jgi:hypothetical protein
MIVVMYGYTTGRQRVCVTVSSTYVIRRNKQLGGWCHDSLRDIRNKAQRLILVAYLIDFNVM